MHSNIESFLTFSWFYYFSTWLASKDNAQSKYTSFIGVQSMTVYYEHFQTVTIVFPFIFLVETKFRAKWAFVSSKFIMHCRKMSVIFDFSLNKNEVGFTKYLQKWSKIIYLIFLHLKHAEMSMAIRHCFRIDWAYCMQFCVECHLLNFDFAGFYNQWILLLSRTKIAA